jgi:hypothetical protein
MAKELSVKGVHVVHTIANGKSQRVSYIDKMCSRIIGGIIDEDNEDTRCGKKMSAESVGETYLWLANQKPALWCHELDLRPAQEKF